MSAPKKNPASSGPKYQDNSAAAIAARLKETLLHKAQDLEVDKIFRALVKLEGSDLHLKVGQPPMVRVGGELKPLNRGPIGMEEMVDLLIPMMDERNLRIFEEEGGADFSHTCDVDGTRWRFRVNMLKALGNIGLVARRINNWIPDFRGLFLPDSIETLCHFEQGMVLLAGVTGFRKKYDDRFDAELHQQSVSKTYSDFGRPDRIHLHRRQVSNQSTRSWPRRCRFWCGHEARRS